MRMVKILSIFLARHLSCKNRLLKWHLLEVFESITNISIGIVSINYFHYIKSDNRNLPKNIREKENRMAVQSVPKATLGRLPLYIQYLKELPDESGATISATKIARALLLGEVQVRKDLALISGQGKPRIGYERCKLIQDIERHLGFEDLAGAVLIGAGKLGRALLDYNGFEEYGIKILAGFDCNEKAFQVGKNSTTVLSINDIEKYCTEHNIKIGIITVGQGSAQEVCDRLIGCGIKAIWNFAPCSLVVPTDVILKQENLALSLAHLNSQIKNN